jgi:hypothetical protein
MSLPQQIENHPFSQFNDSDVAIVQALWRAVESDTPLSPDLAQLACLFDERHPGTPIYEIIKAEYSKTG